MIRPAILCAVLASACLGKSATECTDGRVCPGDRVCVPNGCALPEQLTACNGLADQAPCRFANLAGRCMAGVCYGDLCGNGVLDPGEACDGAVGIDATRGEHCSADCARVESCGNGIVEPDIGEQCDDGNSNPADGCDACTATRWNAHAIISGNSSATSVDLAYPRDLAFDNAGNLYIADWNHHQVRRVDVATGHVTTVAGSGVQGFAGDGVPAITATLSDPTDVAVDGLGNVYIADAGNERVRRVDAQTGIITTVAGSGVDGFSGDGGLAISAAMQSPEGIVVDGLGNLYIAEGQDGHVRVVNAATGIITTVAGGGNYTQLGDNGPAVGASLSPDGLALDAAGNLYIADGYNRRIRRVDPGGTITTVAGNGTLPYTCDSGPAADIGIYPSQITLRGDKIYFANFYDNCIQVLDLTTQQVTALAGTSYPGYSGDGGPALSATLSNPLGVALDASGNMFIADSANNVIRRVDAATGNIATFAGTGRAVSNGDGGAATCAQFVGTTTDVIGVSLDGAGNQYVVQYAANQVRRIDATTGVITTVAGNGIVGYAGDGGDATHAQLNGPESVAVDGAGNVYIDDAGNAAIRRVDATTGIITTIAGDGSSGYSGDGGPASGAEIDGYGPLAVDSGGNLILGDGGNHRIRKIDTATGIITTIVGTGVRGTSGDGGPATSAEIGFVFAISIDGQGNLYILDDEFLVRRVDAATHNITTVVSGGLTRPSGLAVDDAGNLYVGDSSRVFRFDATTHAGAPIAGNGTPWFSGDGGPASASMIWPAALAYGPGGLYIADFNNWVRRIDPSGRILTIAGPIDPPGMGPIAQASLADPHALVMTAPFTLIAGGTSGTVQVVRESVGRVEVVAGRYPQRFATADLARFRDLYVGSVGGVAYDAAQGRIFYTDGAIEVVTIADPDDATTWHVSTVPISLHGPTGLYYDDAAQILYVADTGNHAVRAIDLSSGVAAATSTTVAGTLQTRGFYGDGGAATSALLYAPVAVTKCPDGDLYIADTGNNRVRRVEAGTNLITTVLGEGTASSSGQGAPATSFPVDAPSGIACDAAGDVFVTSRTAVRMLPWASDATPGVVDGTGPVETIYGAAPRTAFPEIATSCLTGVAIKDATTLRVVDSCSGMLVELAQARGP